MNKLEQRNPLYNPLCGDIWKLATGQYIVIDYIDPFIIGFTRSSGERQSFNYRDSYTRWLQKLKAILVSTFEENPFFYCDNDGYTPRHDINTSLSAKDSIDFINKIIKITHGK